MASLSAVPNRSRQGVLRLACGAIFLAGGAVGVWFGLRGDWVPKGKLMPAHTVKLVDTEAGSQPATAVDYVRFDEPVSATPMPPPAAVPSAAQLRGRVDTVLVIAQKSPSEALRWAKTLPADERSVAVVAAANEMARTTPAQALAALAELEPSAERDAALAHSASQWAAIDPKSAMDWAIEGVPGELRERICSAVAIALANRDPRTAADFLATQMTDGVPLRSAAVSVAQRWAQHDDRAARQWAEQFPSGSLRDDALREIATQARAKAGPK